MDIRVSKDHCKEVARTRARNFYYGMKLVPEDKRDAQFALYAWNRLADDLADEEGELSKKVDKLHRFKAKTHQVIEQRTMDRPDLPDGPIWPAFHDALKQFPIRPKDLDDMIEGQLIDQDKTRYANFDELYDYCYKVASVVGLTCIEIWGHDGKDETYQLAEWRGIAFQLTNILRDVREDAERDRIYLPQEVFPGGQVTPQELLSGPDTERVKVINDLVKKAEDYYQKSAALDARISPDGLPCMWAMTEIYHGLLRKIKQNPGRVLTPSRVSLGASRKIWIAFKAQRMKKGVQA